MYPFNRSVNEMTEQVQVLEDEVSKQTVQLKNAQEDLNFAQLCVKNLQASLAVYTASEVKEEKKEEVKDEVKDEVKEIQPCEACVEKEQALVGFEKRVQIMDEELMKLRSIVMKEVGSLRSVYL